MSKVQILNLIKRPAFIAALFTAFAALSIIYFYKSKTYYTSVPIQLTAYGQPYVDVNIEGQNYPFLLDLGSRMEIKLYSDTLKNLRKSLHGNHHWRNSRGIQLEIPSYKLNKIKIGNLTFKNPIAAEFPKSSPTEYLVWKHTPPTPAEKVGSLGLALLHKTNLLLDINTSKLILTNNFNKLKTDGYDISTFSPIPFELASPSGIFLKIDTDVGLLRLLLDTGCSRTVIHDFFHPEGIEKQTDSHGYTIFTSKEFNINGIDFGHQKLYCLHMIKNVNNYDGFLGMDFIKNHIMYIDFISKTLYIKPVGK
ncbi:hypothetical protein COB21_03460 [Candidatus Aerophobetes bacterium]|uniref:Peptidase A2 domain-containing protein n=1 Tax=Aerophobetes bacterium TaxID=2030807 RepID=A0A2A4X383_UNCAE|nr:MAG: hypothetical protein COB21_03460 [Candidatus Aerophobetes bacterium]